MNIDPKDQEVQAAVEGLINLYPRIGSMQSSETKQFLLNGGRANPRGEVAIHTKKETVTKAVCANSAKAASPSTTPSLPESLPRLCNSDILKACLQQHLELAAEKPQGNSLLAQMSMIPPIQQTSHSAGSALTTTSLSAEDIGSARPVAAPLAAGEHAPLSHGIPTTWYELPQWKYWQSLLGDRRHTLADKKGTIVTDNFWSDRTRRSRQSIGETWAYDKHKQLESMPVTESQLQSTGRQNPLIPRRLPSEVEGESETPGSKKLRSETEPSVFWPGGKEQGSPPNIGSAAFSRNRRAIERKKKMHKGNHVNRKEEYTLPQRGGEGPCESSSHSSGGNISVGPPPPTSVDKRGQWLQQPGQLPTSPPNLQMLPTADMPLVAYLLQQQMQRQMQQAQQNFQGVPPLGQTSQQQQQQQQQNRQQLTLHGTSGPLFQALNLQQQLFLQQQLQLLDRARQMPQAESQTQNAVPSVQSPPVLAQQALALNNFPHIFPSVMPHVNQPQAYPLLAASSGLPTGPSGAVSSSQILPLNQGSPVEQNFQQILQQQHQLWLLQQQIKLELQQQQQQLQQQQQPRGDGGGIHKGTSMRGRNEGISRAEPQIGKEGSAIQQCPEVANNDRQQAFGTWPQFIGTQSSYPGNLHGGNRVRPGQPLDFSSQPGFGDVSTPVVPYEQAGSSRYKGAPGNQGTRDVILKGKQGNLSFQGTSQQRQLNNTQELVQVPIQVCVPGQTGLEWAGKSAVLQARYIDPSQSMPWSSGVILPPGTNLQSQTSQSTNEMPPACAFPFFSFESKPPKCETKCAMTEDEPKTKDFNASQESVEEGDGDDDVVTSALDTSLSVICSVVQ